MPDTERDMKQIPQHIVLIYMKLCQCVALQDVTQNVNINIFCL